MMSMFISFLRFLEQISVHSWLPCLGLSLLSCQQRKEPSWKQSASSAPWQLWRPAPSGPSSPRASGSSWPWCPGGWLQQRLSGTSGFSCSFSWQHPPRVPSCASFCRGQSRWPHEDYASEDEPCGFFQTGTWKISRLLPFLHTIIKLQFLHFTHILYRSLPAYNL